MAIGYLLRLAVPHLVDHPDLVLATSVGDVGDVLTVSRPGDVTVVGARAACQIPCRPVLDRNGKDVTAGHHDGSLAFRRQIVAAQLVGHRDATRSFPQAIVGDLDRDSAVIAVGDVEDVELTIELVDDAAVVISARPAHVPELGVRNLLDATAYWIVGVQVEPVVPIRDEVDPVADPHWVALGAHGV